MRTVMAIAIWYLAAPCAIAEDAAPYEQLPSKADQRAAKRLELMRGAIDDFKFFLPDPESSFKFSARPLLRYNDQTREAGGGVKGVLDATVWRLGETGRPKAVVTLEIYIVDQGSPLLTYEFVSLTPQKFDMTSARRVRWMPHSTDLVMEALANAPPPADTPRERLLQMRELARRFTAEEKLGEQKIELRLLSQPIDRYDDAAANIRDGAAFVFANGTNPEMGLLLECSDKNWSYGLFRLASAGLFAQFDGKSLVVAPKPAGYPVDAPYTAARHSVSLPDDDAGE
jgi:hypothetical protein